MKLRVTPLSGLYSKILIRFLFPQRAEVTFEIACRSSSPAHATVRPRTSLCSIPHIRSAAVLRKTGLDENRVRKRSYASATRIPWSQNVKLWCKRKVFTKPEVLSLGEAQR